MIERSQLPFNSPYRHDFVRLASCVPQPQIADPLENARRTLAMVQQADQQGVALMVFPELGLSGYSIEDLLQQDTLLEAVEAALTHLVAASVDLNPVFVVGAPLRQGGRLFNCAVALHRGRVLGIVPKSFLPNYREFYERRWFASGVGVVGERLSLADQDAPFGTDLIFVGGGSTPFSFHAEICEDVWVPTPPSTAAALAGAEILLNLSASNIVVGKADARHRLCSSQSLRCLAAYAYSAAGPGESTNDLAWDGQASIFELGDVLAETPRFSPDPQMAVADIDVGRLRQERIRTGSFGDAVAASPEVRRVCAFTYVPPRHAMDLRRSVERFPYVPSDDDRLKEQCHEAFAIQVQGLAQRLKATGLTKLVIGVSGGLDSTHALLVSVRAMRALGLPSQNVLAFTLPGFATSEATRSNAWALMGAMGVTARELDIKPAAIQMLKDLGHPYGEGRAVYDVTFENVQAGLRTDYLFRLANQAGGLVVGTGDLSELALGWCTYGVGDHMSHYGVNASVSKTLIQHLIRYVATSGEFDIATEALLETILASEISPELVPAAAGETPQSTQAVVGPYELQDFNLYYLSRYGFRPSKIAYLAWTAWQDVAQGHWPAGIDPGERHAYDLATIKGWLRAFVVRFFTNQFKRSCLPNGPKISSGGSLSPRGDWRAPSDAPVTAWLAELDAHVPDRL